MQAIFSQWCVSYRVGDEHEVFVTMGMNPALLGIHGLAPTAFPEPVASKVDAITQPLADLFTPLEMPTLELPDLSTLVSARDRFESNMPKVEMENLPTHLQVKLTLPEAMDPRGISVEVQEHVLTVKAKNRHESETRQDGYYRKDFNQRSFSREIKLPAEVDAKQTQARLEGSTLFIQLPKQQIQAPVSYAIPVQGSAPNPFGR